jgi:hypothetical protein
VTLTHLRLALVAALAVAAAVAWSPRFDAPGASAANGSWTGEYFNNTTLSGAAVLTRNDGSNPTPSPNPSLDKFWDLSPGPGVNADNFSVRWQRTDTYTAATYRFTIITDDGMRLYTTTR